MACRTEAWHEDERLARLFLMAMAMGALRAFRGDQPDVGASTIGVAGVENMVETRSRRFFVH